MENLYYTYAYLREDGTPYYIGKGKGKRAYEKWNRIVSIPEDKKHILILKKGLSEDEAFRHEIYMIAIFGRKDIGTGILCNLCAGGRGSRGQSPYRKRPLPSMETKLKLRALKQQTKWWCHPTERSVLQKEAPGTDWIRGMKWKG